MRGSELTATRSTVPRPLRVQAAIFVEKVTSIGARAALPVAVALAGAALWVTL